MFCFSVHPLPEDGAALYYWWIKSKKQNNKQIFLAHHFEWTELVTDGRWGICVTRLSWSVCVTLWQKQFIHLELQAVTGLIRVGVRVGRGCGNIRSQSILASPLFQSFYALNVSSQIEGRAIFWVSSWDGSGSESLSWRGSGWNFT